MSTHLSSTEQRLRDLETLFVWEGALDNARIREVFGLQPVQASRWVMSFVAEHGAGVQRATSHAPVKPAEAFKPMFERNGADDYLRLVESMRPSDVAPFVTDVRYDLSPTAPELFAVMVQACRSGTGVDVFYRSMAEPDGLARRTYPHSLVRAARRWHVRAWCELRQAFRDFALGRVASASLVEAQSPMGMSQDKEWNELVRLVVVAHPALNPAQQNLIRHEYLGGQESKTIEVKQAIAGYVIQDLRIGIDLERDTPPAFQLYLSNAAELSPTFVASPSA